MSWPGVDSKTQLRLNILLHRQKLLKLLENTNDTTLKPRIKFDPSDFDKLLSKTTPKEEPILIEDDDDDVKVKIEPVNEPEQISNEAISVSSSEEWNSTPPVVSERKDTWVRRSSRVTSVRYNYEYPYSNLPDDHIYASDPLEEEKKTCRKREPSILNSGPSPLPVGNQIKGRFRESFDRVKHNAKERQCRETIARMFIMLRDSCSNFNSNRRNPSKQSILLAAKNECDLLLRFEKKLITNKNELHAINIILKNKLKKLKCQSRQ